MSGSNFSGDLEILPTCHGTEIQEGTKQISGTWVDGLAISKVVDVILCTDI